jgi:hypothetical protein
MNKTLYTVKYKYFNVQFLCNFKKPACISQEYGEFLFNWSIETAKQFAKHLLSMQPTKFYISSTAEIEAITTKKDIFQKIIDNYNKADNHKIDKFEIISILMFIVESSFEVALPSTLQFFCLENESNGIITRTELGLFFDSFFRSLHNIVILEDIDDLYLKTKTSIVRLADSEVEDAVAQIFDKDTEEMNLDDVVK